MPFLSFNMHPRPLIQTRAYISFITLLWLCSPHGDEAEAGSAVAPGAAASQVLTFTQGDLWVMPGDVDDDLFWLCPITSY